MPMKYFIWYVIVAGWQETFRSAASRLAEDFWVCASRLAADLAKNFNFDVENSTPSLSHMPIWDDTSLPISHTEMPVCIPIKLQLTQTKSPERLMLLPIWGSLLDLYRRSCLANSFWSINTDMSRLMTKPTKWVSTQSDQSLHCPYEGLGL